MAKPKQIINDATQSVDEYIAGLLLQYPNQFVKLQNHHVILTAVPPPPGTVQLLSGGGSGHEPSHAGWVGHGMLSGAVCGGIFASPSVGSILAAIRACAVRTAPSTGILLIVKNYTGDRLNFGMAAELANQEGILCRMVVVADDCALERTKGITGARGVAGTILVHKVAGAAAAQGMSLDGIVSIIEHLKAQMGTLGIALDSVTVPGADTVNDRLDGTTIEIGLGIHGEAGLRQSKLLTADEMAKEMVTTIRDYGRTVVQDDGTVTTVPLFEHGDDLCILVNNLGGTSNFEMSILANSCVRYLEEGGGDDGFQCKVTRLFVGSYMTSFNMHGVSLTIVNLSSASKEIINLLDAPCDAPAWRPCDVWRTTSDTLQQPRPSAIELPEVVVDRTRLSEQVRLPPLQLDNFSETARDMVLRAAEALIDAEVMLTQYDTIVGDGDAGITMKRGATEVMQRINEGKIALDHPVTMLADMADAVSDSMGGTSGVLLELMLRKMSSSLSRADGSIGVSELAQSFQAGVDAISLYGGATVGARTMLDAMVPAARVLVETNNLSDASRMAKSGADGTAEMTMASAGRSNYLSEETLRGTPDPGAVAVAIVFEALAPL